LRSGALGQVLRCCGWGNESRLLNVESPLTEIDMLEATPVAFDVSVSDTVAAAVVDDVAETPRLALLIAAAIPCSELFALSMVTLPPNAGVGGDVVSNVRRWKPARKARCRHRDRIGGGQRDAAQVSLLAAGGQPGQAAACVALLLVSVWVR